MQSDSHKLQCVVRIIVLEMCAVNTGVATSVVSGWRLVASCTDDGVMFSGWLCK